MISPVARQLLPPIPALAGPAARLFLTSTTLLFVELLLIRWIPANVIYVGFFSNFLLIASFLGIGLGILLGRSERRLPVSPFTLLLFGLVVVVLKAQLNVQLSSPGEQIFYGLELNHSADTNFLVLPVLMVAVVALMAILALPLGGLLRSMAPLRAYAIDIAGSLTGIAAFALMSVAGLEPSAWFSVAAALLALLALGKGVTVWSAVPAAAMAGVLALVVSASGKDAWSPYYRITAYDDAGRIVSARPDGSGTGTPRHLFVSGIPHQSMDTAAMAEANELQGQVYRWLPGRTFKNVLIIGAGSGTDTTLALKKGAEHIDAVEIDPVIAQVGRRFHPEHPYDDPRVTVHIDDGRSFLRRTTEQYDLIVFALTDSLTLVTSTANVRLESFLYTEESFAAARDRLSPDGVFVMYNWYREPWLVEKLTNMATAVFERPPAIRLPGPTVAVFASGPGIAAAQDAGTLGDAVDAQSIGTSRPTPATDDWPFIYLLRPGIAPYYLVALGLLLAFAAVAVAFASRVTKISLRRGFSPHFFVLGIAFLLLETRSLVTFSLLFGTTWLVNALVLRHPAERVGRDRHQRALPAPRAPSPVRGAVRHACAGVGPPAGPTPDRPTGAAVCAGRSARLRADRVREPDLRPLVPRHGNGGHVVRQQPARRDGRRRAGVRGAAQRIRLAAHRRGGALHPRLAGGDAIPAARRSRAEASPRRRVTRAC